MGLDVYLYKYENKPKTDRLESEYETVSESNWNENGGCSNLSDEQKEAVRQKNKSLAESLGLDEYGDDKINKVCIKMDSTIDKDHIFKIGYFRSSYNDGGINRVLENLGVPTLYDIFEAGDEYCFQPDWERALERCCQAIAELEGKGNYACFKSAPNMFSPPECESEQRALEIFVEEVKNNGSFEQYSNLKGAFYQRKPLKVLALIPGTDSMLGRTMPCTYVVIEGENAWYLTALKIVKETIEYVLSQSDINKYYLHWSS